MSEIEYKRIPAAAKTPENQEESVGDKKISSPDRRIDCEVLPVN